MVGRLEAKPEGAGVYSTENGKTFGDGFVANAYVRGWNERIRVHRPKNPFNPSLALAEYNNFNYGVADCATAAAEAREKHERQFRESYHTITLNIAAEPSRKLDENAAAVRIDGMEVKSLTAIDMKAGVGGLTQVTLTFNAHVTTLSGQAVQIKVD